MGVYVIVIFLGFFAGSMGETTEGYKAIVRPLIEECRENMTFTDDDAAAVLHMKREHSPVAMCLADCVTHKLGLMKDGHLASPEEMLEPYKRLFADVPKLLEDPIKMLTACYNEEMKNPHTNSCEIAFHTIACTTVISGQGK